MFAPRGWLSRSLAREMYFLFSRSSFFDQRWYRDHHLSGALKWQDPIWHFIHHGGLAGLAPSRSFDSAYYLEKNDDVRVARLNPLYHFLTYGQAERRLALRSAQEMVAALMPEASAVRSFLTPHIGNPRVSILLDTETPQHQRVAFIATAISLSLPLRATLRVLHRGIPSPLREISEALPAEHSDLRAGLEITPVPLTATYSDIPFYADEVSVATSWSSARALRFATTAENSWFIAPSPRVESQTTPPTGPEVPAGFAMLRNTPALQNENALGSRPWPSRLPLTSSTPHHHQNIRTQQWRIGIVNDAGEDPLAFSIGLEAISLWLAGSEESVEVKLLGDPVAPFSFLEEFQPLPLQRDESIDCLVVLSSATLGDAEKESLGNPHIIHVAPGQPPLVEAEPHSVSRALAQAHVLWKKKKDTR